MKCCYNWKSQVAAYHIWKSQVEAYLGYKPTDEELLDAMYEDGLLPKLAAQEYAEWMKVEKNLEATKNFHENNKKVVDAKGRR